MMRTFLLLAVAVVLGLGGAFFLLFEIAPPEPGTPHLNIGALLGRNDPAPRVRMLVVGLVLCGLSAGVGALALRKR